VEDVPHEGWKTTMSRRKQEIPRELPEETAASDDTVIKRALLWSVAVIGIGGAALVGVAVWLNRAPAATVTRQSELIRAAKREMPPVEIPAVPFADITQAAGIRFVHATGARGEKLLPETMGGGCAFLDYDQDGAEDLLLINGCDWPWSTEKTAPRPTLALYRNDGHGQFTDVTAGSGLDVTFYGMGVAVGDYDNDGWPDVFVSAVGRGHLFHNDHGKFVDVTEAAGVGGSEHDWGTGCCWFDYDNDGHLDLFVGNYVRWSREIDAAQDFRLVGLGRAYGPPLAFEGAFPHLYRNDGHGHFTDVSAEAGIQIRNLHTAVPVAKTLGVIPIDLDEDGWIDLVIANDTVQNFVFHNTGHGRFEEIGTRTGIAFDSQGAARGAMGIDAGWFRNDQCLGVAIGNFANEMTALYVSETEPLQFFDAATATGLGPPTRLSLTFGVVFFDYDLDGRLDLLSANGHLEEDINKVQPTQYYAQPPKLFWNCGPNQSTEFVPVPPEKCGADLGQRMVGRGSAFADIDGDGDLDVLIAANGGTPRLLRNDQHTGHHWLRFKLIGRKCARDAIGATVSVVLGGGRVLRREVNPTRSYLSQSELPVSFGLGAAARVDRVVIRWPGGGTQELTDVAVDRVHVVEQAP
jgi:enediyne biosynthesis protein E4